MKHAPGLGFWRMGAFLALVVWAYPDPKAGHVNVHLKHRISKWRTHAAVAVPPGRKVDPMDYPANFDNRVVAAM